jgi:CRP/FNR family putative post-exponential-phase nitrogen-starvation transcriptional regulator
MREIKNKADINAEIQKSGFMNFFSFPADSFVKLLTFLPHEYIIEESKLPSHLFFLTSGRAKLYITLANGKIALIDFFRAPCFIGEMELVGHKQDICSVQAIEPCSCLALPISQCREKLLSDPVFLREICLYLGSKNARNIRSLTKNQAYTLENRLAGFILLSTAVNIYGEKHSHAADYLGVSYRHLLYVMAQFVEKGYLKKEKRVYKIADRAALLKLAHIVDPELTSEPGKNIY